ncbi:cation diffusion facilitator family transporter [Cytobacillus purgationiresistens]|uniref:Cobalt-zinc-cadmium efflux system protein n=1 Tax=Cytobacillus purgationiresistens TaxID=863449 RepID=A0ABU0ACL2_9BACI|nr:cation diffusion facilitator family transporter [Cytobacillus purgationiresistens]MDQ0268993.1 cobalt-zinc-cadmium efflux system protein [Cytobacillus purgationiresistens]
MGHGHSHGSHHHHSSTNKKVLLWAFFLIASFMVVELIGGIMTNSLALLSDAGHMLSDAAALGLSFIAIKMAEKKSTDRKTFGYKRFEIIAAAINGLTLILIALYIFYEAYHRLLDPPAVQSLGMLAIAAIGLIVNIAAAFILMKGDKDDNLNVKSAFLHVIGDMLGSVGAIIAALLIYFFNWGIADPIASAIVAILILISGWRVMKESFHVLMEGTPDGLEIKKIKLSLQQIPEVADVHDLHVWTITSGYHSLSCHIIMQGDINHDEVLRKSQVVLHNEFGIEHSTIQVEGENSGCPGHQESCN